MKRILLLISFFCLSFYGQSIYAQIDTTQQSQELTLNRYLQLVSQNNLEYAAEKFNVDISDAAIELSKILPDPTLSFDWLENREDKSRTGFGYTSELGTTVELWGKRKARISLAESKKQLTQALLDDYFRNLQADAAILYFEAVKQNQLYEVKKSSFETMQKLAQADSIRLVLGSIMETDAIQTKLESGILFNELLQAEAERNVSHFQLNLMMGLSNLDTILIPEISRINNPKFFVLDNLIDEAIKSRADIEAARYNKEISAKVTTLTKKERKMDVDLNLGFENDFYVPNNIPNAKIYSAGIAIPLKFSNMNKGDIDMARYSEQQMDKRYNFVLLKIKTEVTEAFQNYISTEKQLANFENNLLKQSESVLKGKIYSYQRGETSLLEVLNAQRTYNKIQSSFIEIVNKSYVSLVEIERASGIWDINL